MSLTGVGIALIDMTALPVDAVDDAALPLTTAEREYCRGKADPRPHVAARLAAKQAACRAFGRPEDQSRDFEVLLDPEGRPSLSLPADLDGLTTHLSLTHDGDYAMATVLAQGQSTR